MSTVCSNDSSHPRGEMWTCRDQEKVFISVSGSPFQDSTIVVELEIGIIYCRESFHPTIVRNYKLVIIFVLKRTFDR